MRHTVQYCDVVDHLESVEYDGFPAKNEDVADIKFK